jgi:MoaA/NifB/PqqE/SkfB family radical SAM enzyme
MKRSTEEGRAGIFPIAKDKYENLLLALLEEQAGADEVWSYPIGLVWDPSSVCQLKCPFCINHLSPPVRTRTTMKWELFERLVDEMGRFLFQVWLFNWGEPFVNKHIIEMVALLKKHNVEVRISSHLSMPLSDEAIESLIKCELNWLTVSIDGMSQESYGTYRVGGDLMLALSNMERIAKAKKKMGSSKPHIDWQYLVFSFNEHEISAARDFAKRAGVDFRPAPPYVAVDNYSNWLSTMDEYVMDIYKKKPVVDAPTSQPAPQPSVHNRMTALSAREIKACDWHYLISALNANGSVSPCCGIMVEAEDFDSVAEKTFRDVWNNDKYRKVRRHYRTEGHSSSGDTSGLVCFNCPRREIMGYGQDIVRRALLSAPGDIQKQARLFLPEHPLIKSLFKFPVGNLSGVVALRQNGLARKLLKFAKSNFKFNR